MNIKSAEKALQFGTTKCKSILVGKNKKLIQNNCLVVDKWVTSHVENEKTGDTDLVEQYQGKIEIEKAEEYKYGKEQYANKRQIVCPETQMTIQ